jgi:hypothetical protein
MTPGERLWLRNLLIRLLDGRSPPFAFARAQTGRARDRYRYAMRGDFQEWRVRNLDARVKLPRGWHVRLDRAVQEQALSDITETLLEQRDARMHVALVAGPDGAGVHYFTHRTPKVHASGDGRSPTIEDLDVAWADHPRQTLEQLAASVGADRAHAELIAERLAARADDNGDGTTLFVVRHLLARFAGSEPRDSPDDARNVQIDELRCYLTDLADVARSLPPRARVLAIIGLTGTTRDALLELEAPPGKDIAQTLDVAAYRASALATLAQGVPTDQLEAWLRNHFAIDTQTVQELSAKRYEEILLWIYIRSLRTQRGGSR